MYFGGTAVIRYTPELYTTTQCSAIHCLITGANKLFRKQTCIPGYNSGIELH